MRSISYKIQQGILEPKLSKYCSSESTNNIFEGFNNFKNKLQEEKVESKDPYSWLEPDDPRRKMSDRKIIESILLDNRRTRSLETIG